MKLIQGILTILAVFIVMVSLINSGGTILALIIASLIILVAVAVPFVKEYVLAASKGKWDSSGHPDRREVRDE